MKGDPDLRQAVYNRLRREKEATGAVSNESVRQAAHLLGTTTRQVRRYLSQGGRPAARPGPPRGYALADSVIDVMFSVGGFAAEAYRELQRTGQAPGCSLRTFQRRVAEMDPALRATALDGWRGAIGTFTYAAKNAPYRGHTYCLDHTPVPVPVVAYRGAAEWFYQWVTVVWDEATRLALAGVAIDHDPQSETTREVLIAAFEGFDLDDGTRAGGMPENVLSDRGSDLIS